jgi:hypothetical protein
VWPFLHKRLRNSASSKYRTFRAATGARPCHSRISRLESKRMTSSGVSSSRLVKWAVVEELVVVCDKENGPGPLDSLVPVVGSAWWSNRSTSTPACGLRIADVEDVDHCGVRQDGAGSLAVDAPELVEVLKDGPELQAVACHQTERAFHRLQSA